MTPKKPTEEKKKTIAVRLHPEMIKALKDASERTGLKMVTIIEQGIQKRLKELK